MIGKNVKKQHFVTTWNKIIGLDRNVLKSTFKSADFKKVGSKILLKKFKDSEKQASWDKSLQIIIFIIIDLAVNSEHCNDSISLNITLHLCIAQMHDQMETFSALLAICAGNSPVPGWKKSWGWWFETLSRPLWCHCNGYLYVAYTVIPNALSLIRGRRPRFINCELSLSESYHQANVYLVFYHPVKVYVSCGNIEIVPHRGDIAHTDDLHRE